MAARVAHIVECILHNLLGYCSIALACDAVAAGNFAQGALLVLTVPGRCLLQRVCGGELESTADVQGGAYAANHILVFLLVCGLVNVRHGITGVEVVGLIISAVFHEFLIIRFDGHRGVGADGLVKVVVVCPVLDAAGVREVVGDLQTVVKRLLVCSKTALKLIKIGLEGDTLEVAVAD